MTTYDKDGHLYGGDGIFNCEYFHIGNEEAEKTYINIENEELEIHNLVEPTEDNDAATKKYVDDNASGGGGGGDVVKIVYDEYDMSVEDLGVAVKAVCDAGKIPAIVEDGFVYYCQEVTPGVGSVEIPFVCWSFNITTGALATITFIAKILEYTEGDGWTMQDAYQEIYTR